MNVFGVGIGVSEFVPRMIDSGRPGQVVVTSSGDGGFAPVPTASVCAASKAAVSCFTEALRAQPHRQRGGGARLGVLSIRRAHGHRALHRGATGPSTSDAAARARDGPR
ncbi:MAG: SDR family NAD(P)-dependent oxidoreductase [Microthrixaceae bacterium]